MVSLVCSELIKIPPKMPWSQGMPQGSDCGPTLVGFVSSPPFVERRGVAIMMELGSREIAVLSIG